MDKSKVPHFYGTLGHCRVQHNVTVPPSTQDISVQTVLPFCAFVVTSAFICGHSSFFYLGDVKKSVM